MSQDYIALEWVKGEIGETLQQAQQALEVYVENPEDKSRLKFCLSYLHQIHGTLQMVEFYGAALLAEEMEAVASALAHGELKNERDGLEILMQAIIQLPHYLEHVKVGRRDLPVVLLPILNELRSARGEVFLSETALFKPTIPEAHALTEQQVTVFSGKEFNDWVRKVRQMFQAAMLQLLQQKQPEVAKDYLHKTFQRLYKALKATPQGRLWLAALAFSEWLKKQQSMPASAKQLLRELDHLLKELLEQGSQAVAREPSHDLIKNLLFYVARTDVEAPGIQLAQETFGLRQALPTEDELEQERSALSGPDKDTVTNVIGALIDEIAMVKDRLDLLVRTDEDRLQVLTDLQPALKQLSDTMGMLGMGMPRKVMQEQLGQVSKMLDEQQAPDSELLDMAGALLYVEATLSGMQKDGDLRQQQSTPLSDAQLAVLREARNVLEQVKEAIVEYIAKQWDVHEIGDVPRLLHSIEGSLNMIPLPRVADILSEAASFVSDQLIKQGLQPQWAVLDVLADVLSGVEYYLERYSQSTSNTSDDLLDRAEQSLTQLPKADGADVDATTEVVTESDDGEMLTSFDNALDLAGDDEQEGDSASAGEPETAIESEPGIESEPAEAAVSSEPEADIAAEPEVAEDAEALDELAAEPVAPAIEVDTAEEDLINSEPVVTANEDADDDSLIDDEILEIFLEEAEEVTETLQEFWPQYVANQADDDALATVRRAYHTLKGSGRMVEAEVIGELAWSIENMFNRVLDNTIQVTEDLIALVSHVMAQLPALIDDFRHQRKPSVDTQPLMEYAFALAGGQASHSFAVLMGEASAEADEVAEEQAPAEVDVQVEEKLPIEVDDELIDVFVTEAATHISCVKDFITESRQEQCSNAISDHLQRALHTLKGSAHMAGLTHVAEIAAPSERLVKELRAYHVRNTPGLVDLLEEGMGLLSSVLEPDVLVRTNDIDGSDEFLARLHDLETLLLEPLRQADDSDSVPNPHAITQFLANGMDSLLEADELLQQWQRGDQATLDGLVSDLNDVATGANDAGLPAIQTLAEGLDGFYSRVRNDNVMANDTLVSAASDAHEVLLSMMDCLAAGQELPDGNKTIAQLASLPAASSPTDSTVADIDDELEAAPAPDDSEESQSIELTLPSEIDDDAEIDLTSDIIEDEDSIDLPAAPEVEEPQQDDELVLEATPVDELEAPAEMLSETHVDEDAAPVSPVSEELEALQPLSDEDDELLNIFLEEAQEITETVEGALQRWQDHPENLLEVAQLQRELHTLKGGARMAELHAVADLCHELETLYENVNDGRLSVSEKLFQLLLQAHDTLGEQLDTVRTGMSPRPAQQLVKTLYDFVRGENKAFVLEGEDTPEVVAEVEAPADAVQVATLDESDREILEIFVDEAQELQEALDRALHDWEQTPEDNEAPAEAQRVLHTLKGGARLAGLTDIGDMAHSFEADILKAQQGLLAKDQAFFQDAYLRQDRLINQVESVADLLANDGYVVLGASELVQPEPVSEPEPIDVVEVVEEAPLPEAVETSDNTNVVPLRPQQPTPSTPSAPAPDAATQPAAARKAPQELVKVSADLLDTLVNLAGETSIGRGRLEQQVSDFAGTLDEMEMTLDRLRDQLRRLDIETEAQVLFRQERQGPDYDDFDPLEMDRYSAMQQLSRALMESAYDLLDLKETLGQKSRDAETLLLQQSRVNTELQEGLMKTRMVPFQRMVPRLRRIVRQIGLELDKQVEFRVINADGEMDRTILERLVSPLEHMVRNAMDHGIEDRQQRQQAGKSENGNIELEVSREGGDVVLKLRDDGKGINTEAVRRKAIERGLMEADAQLSDQEITQFILQAGFSTAEAVTQISGRGVGMDVVGSEIKQMGGTVEILSEAGQGTEFVIRLPFTVSVNRALMVRVGDDLYAVPLNNIQGIVRMPIKQLQALYDQPADQRVYEYAGNRYQLDYLGVLMDTDTQPKVASQNLPLPVLLIGGTNPFALQVDALLGSREIVVKTLGPQFASVMGVSGGTILGDGSVVIILDLPAMIRTQASLEYQQAKALDAKAAERRHELERRLPRILVVDDSVTVRKVTTRLLERNGMEVFTAKDGVDAMATMQDHHPDLILLDIEMPRMDGFEVASQVRHDSRLKHIPIIMITSRTGDKHRDRAMSIGVNDYLGKPFQEDKLLAAMTQLLANEGS
ncbi:hybrid sensor histidine kinase/response regulator [Bacterioplanes sanyensis]|uniref:Chemotaxis protein CheA n=1 Tax=Bacterioplanes sanyensis TaxID=1249553 RepID=A0A222FGQ7_9GAMM|nr:Hpt domain-containing protein [Bacterioplanes sanyensis]ASP38178.1 hybrid sensor histidine kinase/response regulator [Bacterioplanes sanyensis]